MYTEADGNCHWCGEPVALSDGYVAQIPGAIIRQLVVRGKTSSVKKPLVSWSCERCHRFNAPRITTMRRAAPAKPQSEEM